MAPENVPEAPDGVAPDLAGTAPPLLPPAAAAPPPALGVCVAEGIGVKTQLV